MSTNKNVSQVAMGTGYRVDDGTTLIGMSARTHASLRGRGFWRQLRNTGLNVSIDG